MESEESAACLLLALPDPCLLAVLQCCADDQRSLLSAARAHSKLHQAAVAALCSVTAVVWRQQQVDGVLLYMERHGQHVNTLDLKLDKISTVSLRQLPVPLQLSSLQLGCLCLQLQLGNGFQGVLGTAGLAALKQLRLKDCKLLDDTSDEQLAAALSLLPVGLEHLSVSGFNNKARFPSAVLQQLQQLTYLELHFVDILGPDDTSNPLQPVQALTRLQDLRLQPERLANGDEATVTASMLSGMHNLTRLVCYDMEVEPGVLAGKSQMQHLALTWCSATDGAADWRCLAAPPDSAPGVAQLLSHLQQLTELSYLDLTHTLGDDHQPGDDHPLSAAVYASLTASSKLQHLKINCCRVPTGVWQHVFPAGKQLQHLKSLQMLGLNNWCGGAAPEGSRLVSCCPNLQCLDIKGAQFDAEMLVALQGFSGLHTLGLTLADPTAAADLQAVCQLTGLRELKLQAARVGWMGQRSCWVSDTEGWLLQLSQMKQLTALTYDGPILGLCREVTLTTGPPDDASDEYDSSDDSSDVSYEPVWRQLLQLHMKHQNPGVAQQAAAALAGSGLLKAAAIKAQSWPYSGGHRAV